MLRMGHTSKRETESMSGLPDMGTSGGGGKTVKKKEAAGAEMA